MAVEKRKYIIELPENTHWIQWIMEGTKDHHPYMDFKQVEELTPYTEPDTESIRKEAYQQGHKDGYNKHDTEKIRKQGYDKGLDDLGNALRLLLFQYSNYTLQELFGYDTARAVVEHYEGSEIVARIRCYEGGVKQDAETIRKEAYDKAFEDAEQVAESGKRAMYQKGLSDAWNTARKICAMDSRSRDEIFGMVITTNILDHNSASKALEEIRAYEQAQKEKEEEIQVGDEVENTQTGVKFIATHLWKNNRGEQGVSGFNQEYSAFSTTFSMVVKTGRHFPEIAEVLAKMKESDNG